MFHILAWCKAASVAGATNEDIPAVVDDEVTTRNSHFILTEQFNLIAMTAFATSITASRFNIPSINAYARHQIWPVFRSGTVVDDLRWQDLRDMPMPLPVNEELAIESTNNLGAATEISNAIGIIAPPTWTRNLRRGIQRVVVGATGALAGVANAWTGNGAITFNENLRGGWYAINNVECFDAGSLAFRLNFAKPYMYGGRKLRPGNLMMEAIGNRPALAIPGQFGEWGTFHSFEPPQFQILANAAGASTQVFRFDLTYMGSSNQ